MALSSHVLTLRAAKRSLRALISMTTSPLAMTTPSPSPHFTPHPLAFSLLLALSPMALLASGAATAATVSPAEQLALKGVVSTADGKPIAGAKVLVMEAAVNVETGADGRFELILAPGSYTLVTMADGYDSRTVDGLSLDGSTPEQQITLETPPAEPAESADSADTGVVPEGAENATQIEGVTVEERFVEGGLSLATDEKKSSAAVAEVIGAEQIKRAGDSDTASALKRVTGLTLVDGKFIYVRGLGERYSSVLLNGATVPSPDPTRRVVPLDLFPTDIIDSIAVQKSYSASMPAEFGGGTIALRTRGIPFKPVAKVSGTLGFSPSETFQDGLGYGGGTSDWFGYGNGVRRLPDDLATATQNRNFLREQTPVFPQGFTPAQVEQFGESLATRGYDTERQKIGPKAGFGASLGNAYAFGPEDSYNQYGFLFSMRYNSEWNQIDEQRREFRASNQGLVERNRADVNRTIQNIELSGFLSAGLFLGENHQFKATTVFARLTDDETRRSQGEDDSQQVRNTLLRWIETQLLSQQLSGEHTFVDANNLNFTWTLTGATAKRIEPNTRFYRYDLDSSSNSYVFSRFAESNSQRFGALDDQSKSLDFAFKYPIALEDYGTLELSAGGSATNRDREADLRSFAFNTGGVQGIPESVFRLQDPSMIFTPQNIRPNGFRLFETTRATDNYVADQSLRGYFFQADYNYNDKFRINLGLRRETNDQSVRTFSISDPNAPPVLSSRDEGDNLPALNATYFFDDKKQLRFGYSETLSRPDFRELSPAPFLDPVQDVDTIGDPNLKTTGLKNYDLRYEQYFSSTESFSVALFYKDFSNPIEKLRIGGGSGFLQQLANADAANIYGLELDVFKGLGFLNGKAGGLWGIDFERFFVSANYSRIKSEISLNPVQAAFQTNLDRPMQGQSPYVSNLQFGYISKDRSKEATLLFNRAGERIAQVGVQTQPDIYEQPFNQLDFTYRQKLWQDWTLRVRARNLLDPNVEFTQGGFTTREYKVGRELSFSLEWAL